MGGVVGFLRGEDIHVAWIWCWDGHGRIGWVILYLITKKVVLT